MGNLIDPSAKSFIPKELKKQSVSSEQRAKGQITPITTDTTNNKEKEIDRRKASDNTKSLTKEVKPTTVIKEEIKLEPKKVEEVKPVAKNPVSPLGNMLNNLTPLVTPIKKSDKNIINPVSNNTGPKKKKNDIN